jgi:hypothetical protein
MAASCAPFHQVAIATSACPTGKELCGAAHEGGYEPGEALFQFKNRGIKPLEPLEGT